MSRFDDHRETLLADLIGEVTNLLRRADAIIDLLNESARTAEQACANLEVRSASIERTAAAMVEASKEALVKHVARRSEELARAAAAAQLKAMEGAARELFENQLAPALRRLERTASTQPAIVSFTRRTVYLVIASVAVLATLSLLIVLVRWP